MVVVVIGMVVSPMWDRSWTTIKHGLNEPILCDSVIRDTIITDEAEWTEYMEEVRQHPDDQDLRNARAFARGVLEKL